MSDGISKNSNYGEPKSAWKDCFNFICVVFRLPLDLLKDILGEFKFVAPRTGILSKCELCNENHPTLDRLSNQKLERIASEASKDYR